jgi:outer membrane protein
MWRISALLLMLGAAFHTGALSAAGRKPPGQADPAFDAALSEAYLSNPQLGVERRRLRETDENVPRALSGWRPHVLIDGSIGASAVFDNGDPTHQPERRVPQTSELSVTQPLYTSGRVTAQVGQAEALVAAERATLQATEAMVLLAAATAFLDVARDQRTVALNRNEEAVLERTLRATEQEFAAGAVTETDVDQTRARLADQRAMLAQAVATLGTSRAEFEQQVGQPPGDLALPTRTLDLPPTLAVAITLVPNNFDVVQSRAAQEASRQGIDIARAGLLPQVSAVVSVARDRETDVQLAHQRDNIAEATLRVRVPLYQGGEQAAEIRQAKEAASRTLLQIDVVLRQARRQVQTAWEQLEGARTRMDQYRQSRAANTVAERGVARQQSVGARTVLDVLNAQQERLTAEVNLVSAQHDAYVAGFQLQAATGQLSAAKLKLAVPIYDPEAHYQATRDRWYGTTPAP